LIVQGCWWLVCRSKRREEVMREGTMKVIAPGDKRRQVASGLGVREERREEVIRYDTVQ